MKNTSKYVPIIIIVLALVVIIAAFNTKKPPTTSGGENNSNSSVSTNTNPSPSASPAASPVTGTAANKTVTKPVAKPIPSSSPLSYTDYVAKLAQDQNSCQRLASSQFAKLYGNLESSSYQSYFNTVNSMCYMTVAGKMRVATSTTGQVYLRNTSGNTAIAECTDPSGTLVGGKNWKCRNMISDSSITKSEYDSLVNSYTTK